MSKSTNKLLLPELQDIFKSNDLVLLTETWSHDAQTLDVPDFTLFSAHRLENNVNAKRYSGGIIAYVRSSLVDQNTLQKSESDDLLFLKFPPKCTGYPSDLLICSCYVLPENSARQPLINQSVFERITSSLAELQCSPDSYVCICGDFNARTKELPDYVEESLSDHLPLPDDYLFDAPLHRRSQDRTLNNNGRQLLNLCKKKQVCEF